MVNLDPDRDHLFWLDQSMVVCLDHGPEEVSHLPHLAHIKLKSLKVQTKWGRCESALSAGGIRKALCQRESAHVFKCKFLCYMTLHLDSVIYPH